MCGFVIIKSVWKLVDNAINISDMCATDNATQRKTVYHNKLINLSVSNEKLFMLTACSLSYRSISERISSCTAQCSSNLRLTIVQNGRFREFLHYYTFSSSNCLFLSFFVYLSKISQIYTLYSRLGFLY